MWTCAGRPHVLCRNTPGAGNGPTLGGYWFLTDVFIYRPAIYKRWENRDVHVTETCQNVPVWCLSSVSPPVVSISGSVWTFCYHDCAPLWPRPHGRKASEKTRTRIVTDHPQDGVRSLGLWRLGAMSTSSLQLKHHEIAEFCHTCARPQQRRDTRHATADDSQDNPLYRSRSNMKKADAWHKHSCAPEILQPQRVPTCDNCSRSFLGTFSF